MRRLEPFRNATLDLDALAAAAADLLAAATPPASDGRVAAQPDGRLVRYYQSLGIVDRPVRYEGRIARYGYRQLLQLVAARLLQGAGHSLAQVQGLLAGATTGELEARVAGALRIAPSAAAPVAASAARRLVAAELAPGITVTVDPARVADPATVLARLARALEEVSR